MDRIFRSHGDTQIQTGIGRNHDSAPQSAHMRESYPRMFLPPLVSVSVDVLSIRIEYFQEDLIRELIDRQARGPLSALARCVLALAGALTCRPLWYSNSVSWL